MGSIMSIGRSKAKLYSTERPSTTFDDVAGYDGVKLEISEVVDFLKTPARFKEIGREEKLRRRWPPRLRPFIRITWCTTPRCRRRASSRCSL